jgi:hypothetical protein
MSEKEDCPEYLMTCGHPGSAWITDSTGNEYCKECCPEIEEEPVKRRPVANRSTESMFLRLDPVIHQKIKTLSCQWRCTYAEVVEKAINQLDDD